MDPISPCVCGTNSGTAEILRRQVLQSDAYITMEPDNSRHISQSSGAAGYRRTLAGDSAGLYAWSVYPWR